MASTSETTPLLADSEPLNDNERSNPEAGVTSTSTEDKPPYYRTTVVLTHLSAALSIIALVFDLAGLCIDAASSNGFYLFWDLRSYVQGLFALSILSTITSSLNLARLRHARRPLWLIINLIVDGVIICYTVALGPEALARDLDQDPNSWLPDKGAAYTAKTVVVVLAIGIIAGLLVGFVSLSLSHRILAFFACFCFDGKWAVLMLVYRLIHLVLLPLRCYVAFVSGSWRTWTVPTGEFKIEFSVKFLRQQEGSGESREVSA
ncbi:hypothetical protein BDV18DRAFT_40055 [Aspergillus unguis]